MIYITQQFYNEQWWNINFYTERYYADEEIDYLRKSTDGTYRIKEFEIPEVQ